tara:strand:+ start:213 stop:446 length:234 start_codon:yes stop_codon:yes gene_type:complete
MEQDEKLRNGIIAHGTFSKKRVIGPIGHGMLVQGQVTVGTYEDGEAFKIDMDGIREASFPCEKKVKVGRSKERLRIR